MNAPELAFVALGSNLGDSARIIARAFGELQKLSVQPLLQSSLWRSTPLDCPPGSPLFVNAVAGLAPLPEETPVTLLAKLRALEQAFGRLPKKIHNESRLLDLDLIAFGRQTADSAELTLPHPRAHLRAFVLQPLCEIAPDWIPPGRTETAAELLRGLQPDPGLRRL
jgi:2-amino-4-hydroxy-6-hydroxymethyldihydropteridine diphosphokinase